MAINSLKELLKNKENKSVFRSFFGISRLYSFLYRRKESPFLNDIKSIIALFSKKKASRLEKRSRVLPSSALLLQNAS